MFFKKKKNGLGFGLKFLYFVCRFWDILSLIYYLLKEDDFEVVLDELGLIRNVKYIVYRKCVINISLYFLGCIICLEEIV